MTGHDHSSPHPGDTDAPRRRFWRPVDTSRALFSTPTEPVGAAAPATRLRRQRRSRTALRLLLALASVVAVLYGALRMVEASLIGFAGNVPSPAELTVDVGEYRRGAVIALAAAGIGVGAAVWARRVPLVVLEVVLLVVAATAAVLFHVSPDFPTHPPH